ncbi:mucin TcMUCII, putative [Trypanosoma cruzi]|nr:mucin TcMUCII, putative [Trypanosoma cruzi]
MMMTCRLLCALLVLALCCCPLLCVADVTPEKAPVPEGQVDGKDSSDVSHTPGGKPATTVGESIPETVAERRSEVGQGGGAPDSEPQPSAASNELQGEGTNDKKNTVSGTSSSAEQGNTSEEDSAQKTTTTTTQAPSPAVPSSDKADQGAEDAAATTSTTTTKPPNTTTTTTTQAPSTTTTEVPAVSTTRTPSSIREIDGSLSSSAWVCAPLLLAVSALAYATVG